jgi:biopolymer transport protein ExbD
MAFAPSKGAKHRRREKEGLILGSMLDFMTVILLFLLKMQSSTGAMMKPSEYVNLPASSREVAPEKAVAILVNPEGVFEDVEKAPRQLVSKEDLFNPSAVILDGLEAYLSEQREFTKHLGKDFKGIVTIQCDKDISYDNLLKVVNTCGQAEYGTLDFVVVKKEKV